MFNPGAAFSLGTSATPVFTVLATVVSLAILWFSRQVISPAWGVALGLIAGGAVGNLVDRLVRAPGFARGHVVDFLALPNWPVFNVADIGVTCGAALVVLLALVALVVGIASGTGGSGSAPLSLAPATPTRVSLPSIDATSSLIPLGLQADGELAVPPLSNPMQASWYDTVSYTHLTLPTNREV